MQITVERLHSTEDCTIGRMTVDGYEFFTVERPWMFNKPKISCIPIGKYKFVPHGWESDAKTKFRRVWRLLDVPGRSAILIHGGNTSQDVIGCLAVGEKRGTLNGREGVIKSQTAIEKLRKIIGQRGGEITIV